MRAGPYASILLTNAKVTPTEFGRSNVPTSIDRTPTELILHLKFESVRVLCEESRVRSPIVANTRRIEPNFDVIGPIRSTRASVVLPLRYPSRSPRCARCLHSLFKVREVAFDERSQPAEHLLELLRGGCVVVLL